MLCPSAAVYLDIVSFRFAYACAAALAATLGSACSCGGDTDCGPGTIDVDGECVPGGPDADNGGCGPGTIPSEQGCVPAVSPADRRPCEGRFGPIAEDDADAVFVDAAFDGSDQIGTADQPYTGIQDAVDAASDGAIVAVAAGTYTGAVTIGKPLSLEGRCAREAIIEGGVSVADTGDVAVRGFTISMGDPGIGAVNVQPIDQEYGLEIRFVLLTQSVGAGILMDNSVVDVLDSDVFMTTAAGANLDQLGSGVIILNGSIFDIANSIVQMSGFQGIDITDAFGLPSAISTASDARSSGTIRDSEVRGNMAGGVRMRTELPPLLPPPEGEVITISAVTIADNLGDGIAARSSRLDVVGSIVRNNEGHGVVTKATSVTVAGNELEGQPASGIGVYLVDSSSSITANSVSGFDGGGIAITGNDGADAALVFGNTLTTNADAGILLVNVDDATVEGNEVSGTVGARTPDQSGHGIWVVGDADSDEATVAVRNNFVHDNAGVGISVENFNHSLDVDEIQFVVRNNTVDDNGFAGINVQESTGGGEVIDNNLSGNAGYGIRTADVAFERGPARVFIENNTIGGTVVSFLSDDGDGIQMVRSHVTCDGNVVTSSARKGIFGVQEVTGGAAANNATGSAEQDLARQASPGLGFPGAADLTGEVFNGAFFGFNLPPPLN